jgi:hypothetical protein
MGPSKNCIFYIGNIESLLQDAVKVKLSRLTRISRAKVQTHKSGIEVVRRRCLNSIPFTICLPCMSGLSVFLSSGGSYFTWQAKSYIPSTIKNSNECCIFLALNRLVYQGSIENSSILIRYF